MARLLPQRQSLVVESLQLFGIRFSGRLSPMLIGKTAQVPFLVAGVHMTIVSSGVATIRRASSLSAAYSVGD